MKNKNKQKKFTNKNTLFSKKLLSVYSSSKFVLMFILYVYKIMDFFIMQHSYRNRFLVVIDGDVYVYKFQIFKFDKKFLSFKPKHIYIGKSKVCDMTNFSVADDKEGFDGNTFLLEFEDFEYGYISGLEITIFRTDYKIIDYIFLMCNNMVPYVIIVVEKQTYFSYNRCKTIENHRIEEETLLNEINSSLDPYDYHVEKCGKDVFKKLEHSLIHACWPGHGENIENEDDILVVEDEVEDEGN